MQAPIMLQKSDVRFYFHVKAAFAKLQLIIDRPIDELQDVNREEWAVIHLLVQFIPVAQTNVHAMHTHTTNGLSNVLIKTAEMYRRLAQLCKTRFETEVRRDAALFEEYRLQNLLVLTAQAPALALLSPQDYLQKDWDQRLSDLVERRQKYLQEIREQMKELKLLADSLNWTHLQLQELCAQLEQKQGLIQNLEAKLKESEVLFKKNMTPAATELAGCEVQQDNEQSFADGDEFDLKLGSNSRAVTSL